MAIQVKCYSITKRDLFWFYLNDSIPKSSKNELTLHIYAYQNTLDILYADIKES